MSFRLFHWVPEFGHHERVYINGEFTQDLDLFFEANEDPDTRPKLFGVVNCELAVIMREGNEADNTG